MFSPQGCLAPRMYNPLYCSDVYKSWNLPSYRHIFSEEKDHNTAMSTRVVRSESMETRYDRDECNRLMIDEEGKKQDPVAAFDLDETLIDTRRPNGDYCKLDIGNDCFVVANEFRGRTLIHIRLYDTSEKGTLYPTKKGVALSPQQWKKLQIWYAEDVDQALVKYREGNGVDLKIHLGGNNYVSLSTGFAQVHIRRWFMPDAKTRELKPTRAGVALSFEQWEKLKDCMTIMNEYIGDILDNVEFCEMGSDHQNQEGALQCFECNPNRIDVCD
ncbi:uncharacterized protein LOC117315366 [Pecten maximus]|uniref:uncharacterized protein LOC117315366 n=1 Tax=Pecten maximus TaxID=6579 RepID=UPI001458E8B3|nr:uncharacterized protein LOC117315366 [Pecten maximus]